MIGHRISIVLRSLGTVFRIAWQCMYGIWRISKLPEPIITIFGGHLLVEEKYVAQAKQLAKMLIDNDLSVLTGGGSGIMQAASYGTTLAAHGKERSMGIGVTGLIEEMNPYRTNYFEVNFFLFVNGY